MSIAGRAWAAFRERVDPRAASLAGLVAVGAYTAVMDLDRQITGSRIDDLILVGRPLVPRRPDLARPVGAVIHAGNGVLLANVYAAIAHSRFPGPPWLRGIAFAMIENCGLYPLAKFSRYHPAVKDGQLDTYWSWPAFVESLPPHVVYGAVVGPLYERWRRR